MQCSFGQDAEETGRKVAGTAENRDPIEVSQATVVDGAARLGVMFREVWVKEKYNFLNTCRQLPCSQRPAFFFCCLLRKVHRQEREVRPWCPCACQGHTALGCVGVLGAGHALWAEALATLSEFTEFLKHGQVQMTVVVAALAFLECFTCQHQ